MWLFGSTAVCETVGVLLARIVPALEDPGEKGHIDGGGLVGKKMIRSSFSSPIPQRPAACWKSILFQAP